MTKKQAAKKNIKDKKKAEPQPTILRGWKPIAEFLGQPVTVAQRWGGSGMPVKREGSYTVASPTDLNRWLGHESGTHEPVHIAAEADIDLSNDLKRSLAAAKGKRTPQKQAARLTR
jgi:hypothetical protein